MPIYTSNLSLAKPATAERAWGDRLNANFDVLDALSAIGGLAVSTTETPSTTLQVSIAAGTYQQANGSIFSFAGSTPVAIPASVVRNLWLTDGGSLMQGASWPTGATPHVRLAVVTTDVDSVTGIADARVACQTSGPARRPVVSVTAAYAISDADGIVLADASGSAFAVTLPTAGGRADVVFTVKRINATNNVTVATTSSQTIDGATTYVLTTQWASVTVVSNGTAWLIVGKV